MAPGATLPASRPPCLRFLSFPPRSAARDPSLGLQATPVWGSRPPGARRGSGPGGGRAAGRTWRAGALRRGRAGRQGLQCQGQASWGGAGLGQGSPGSLRSAALLLVAPGPARGIWPCTGSDHQPSLGPGRLQAGSWWPQGWGLAAMHPLCPAAPLHQQALQPWARPGTWPPSPCIGLSQGSWTDCDHRQSELTHALWPGLTSAPRRVTGWGPPVARGCHGKSTRGFHSPNELLPQSVWESNCRQEPGLLFKRTKEGLLP